ncbi:LLM class flavin-dependent oxidoreductase [Microbacterium awajiense]|uniref:LLM class flavin-dependent oxidoreductase n=1 Tax=Microbacterium awajiense TaxID=415214 RepID=A0ABP7A5S6_9MICO
MRIGLINQLHGRPGGATPAPTWQTISARAKAAERAGFDIFVYEDALLYRGDAASDGVWESMAVSGALALATETIRFGPSVMNAPYRHPGVVASAAETLGEISDGRFVLGVGAGNTDDYRAFGIPADPRYSRFAGWLPIVHGLLRGEVVTTDGPYHAAEHAELVLRGPREVPIVVAARGPRMLRLTARFASGWNWWASGRSDSAIADLARLVRELDIACDESDRDPATLTRTLDFYTVIAPGSTGEAPDGAISGSAERIAEEILGFRSLGIEEVRCDVHPKTTEAIDAMTDVVRLVHAR